MKISVIIPVRNGAATLARCLDSIRMQSGAELEIIILDSMSTDGSIDIANRYGAKIISIPVIEFDHGLTRNNGVLQSTAPFVFFTVQDAWLASDDLLEKMCRHFEDTSVIAVVGHQAVPHEKDKNPFEWYRPVSLSSVTKKQVANKEQFDALAINDQQQLVAWDNVVAMYRKDALIEQLFVKTAFAEDWIWSYHALQKGWKLLHDSSLIVYHYHHQSFQYAFKSTYTVNYHFYKFFKYKPAVPALFKPMAQSSYHLLKNKKLSFKQKLYWIIHNISARVSIYFSTIDFLTRLKMQGEKGIEMGYIKYCKSIPQGKQKK